jgi:hypothetical protein
MLHAAPDASPLRKVGQTFEIDMDRRPLGRTANTEALHDLVRRVPDYKVLCTVTRLIRDRLIEWNVRVVGKAPGGHIWGWEIEPLAEGGCLVSNYCDWSNISPDLRAKFHWPVVPLDRFQRSLENLDHLATFGERAAASRSATNQPKEPATTAPPRPSDPG